MAPVDEEQIYAVVVHIPAEGAVIIERPGLEPVLVIADRELAIQLGHPAVTAPSADEEPLEVPPPPAVRRRRIVIPTNPVFVRAPGAIGVVPAEKPGEAVSEVEG